MSVINKVLRDLDKRQIGIQAGPNPADFAVRSGTSSVESAARPVRIAAAPKVKRNHVFMTTVFVGSLVLIPVIVGFWWSMALKDALTLPAVTAMPKPQASQAPVVVPVLSEPVLEAVVEAVTAVSTALPDKAIAAAIGQVPASHFESTMVPPTKLPPADPPPRTPNFVPVTLPLVGASTPAQPPPSLSASTPAPVPIPAQMVPASAAEGTQKQQQAARDALAQAQSLWNAGSHDSALDLLQQAVASAERSAGNLPTPAALANLVLLVRELGRMQLSEGRSGSVWDTLTRLEPLLRNEPEMWALRANAAQRLGRHQDSVHAYMTALQSRPSEQRWLLGTATSLAALGQIDSATEMADKARAVGPISRDVQTYLRQMGVSIKD